MIKHEYTKDRVVITLTGGSDIFRFAVNMLNDQTEYCEVGRAILVEQRERIGAASFDDWAVRILGEETFTRLTSYFRRDRFCLVCDKPVRGTIPKNRRLAMARALCRECPS